MNGNPVRAAVDLVDAEPSAEFLSDLRARLIAGDVASAAGGVAVETYVPLTPSPARSGRHLRAYEVLVAAAACVAVVVAVVVVRRTDDREGGLRDVDRAEALPLGEAAMFSADKLSAPAGEPGWKQVDDFNVGDYATQLAAINVALPECSQLASVGLAQPTTKSVMVHQDFADGPRPMLHDVWVFATPGDASKAMDVIDGEVFPTCWLKLFDHLTGLNRNITATSTSTVWLQEPTITQHGDRQVVFGQKIKYSFLVGGTDAGAINAFVQVGRAITFIDAQYLGDAGPTSNVERAITASTDALEKVFGH